MSLHPDKGSAIKLKYWKDRERRKENSLFAEKTGNSKNMALFCLSVIVMVENKIN